MSLKNFPPPDFIPSLDQLIYFQNELFEMPKDIELKFD